MLEYSLRDVIPLFLPSDEISARLVWRHVTTVDNGDCGTAVTCGNKNHNRAASWPAEITQTFQFSFQEVIGTGCDFLFWTVEAL